jgi:hypothetical protein
LPTELSPARWPRQWRDSARGRQPKRGAARRSRAGRSQQAGARCGGAPGQRSQPLAPGELPTRPLVFAAPLVAVIVELDWTALTRPCAARWRPRGRRVGRGAAVGGCGHRGQCESRPGTSTRSGSACHGCRPGRMSGGRAWCACRRPSSSDNAFLDLLGDELRGRGHAVAVHGEATWNGVAILSRVGSG